MNLPNLLTFSRIGLACLFVALLLTGGLWAVTGALFVFILACLTDWWDGLLARRRGQATPFGALLDPIADKILVLSAFLMFVWLRIIPAWMVAVLIGREVLITGVRLVVVARGRVLPALASGKRKTVSQMTAILTILPLLVAREAALRWGLSPNAVVLWTGRIGYVVTLVAVVFTIISGLQFLFVNRFVFRHAPAR